MRLVQLLRPSQSMISRSAPATLLVLICVLCAAATAVAQVGERLTNEVPDFSRDASTDELLESAREMFIADNYRLAEMLYKTVLVRDPNHLDAMLELSVVYEKMGKLQHAVACSIVRRPSTPTTKKSIAAAPRFSRRCLQRLPVTSTPC